MGESIGTTIINSLKLITVEPYIFFILFGYMVRLVSFQNLLMDRACRNTFGYSEDICDDLDHHKEEQSKCIEVGNNLYMGVMLLSSLPAIIVAIFLGPWSDKYTRKYPLIISVTGMLLESVAGAVLTIFTSLTPVWYTVIALLSGVSGGLIISISAACSYISDVTDERSRPSRFAVFEFFNIAAIVFGNLFGGLIFDSYGYLAVMCLAPVGFLLALLYVVFLVKETKPPTDKDKRLDMFKDLLRVDNIKQSYLTCSRKRPGNIRLQIWLLVWIGASIKFIDMGTLAAGFPYAKKMYEWGVSSFSNASIVFYTVNALVTVGIIPALSTRLRLHEAAIGLVGILSLTSKLVLLSVAYTGPYFYLACLSGTLANGAGVAVRSRLSKLVNKEELGRIFSLLGTCESVTPLMGTIAFLQIYNASLNVFPGMPFALGAIFVIPCAVIFTWMMKMPTISLAEYAREEQMKYARPMKTITSQYNTLENEKAVVY